jgi:hypothetical protein
LQALKNFSKSVRTFIFPETPKLQFASALQMAEQRIKIPRKTFVKPIFKFPINANVGC